jgi:arginyl-tRNA synthetase
LKGKGVKSNPREVATKIVGEVSANDVIEKLDVAGPGFVNIFVKKSFIENQVYRLLNITYLVLGCFVNLPFF